MAINGENVENAVPAKWQRIEHELYEAVVGNPDPAQAELAEHLAVALLQTDAFHSAKVGRGDTANLERYIWTRDLRTVVELINTAPSVRENKLAAGLVRLLVALEDLNSGRVHAALRPAKRSPDATGPRSRQQSMLRGILAGILDCLMHRTEMSEGDAARWLQRRLAASGVHQTVNGLIAWRKQARRAKKDDQMRITFHKMHLEDWSDPLDRADRMVEVYLKLS